MSYFLNLLALLAAILMIVAGMSILHTFAGIVS